MIEHLNLRRFMRSKSQTCQTTTSLILRDFRFFLILLLLLISLLILLLLLFFSLLLLFLFLLLLLLLLLPTPYFSYLLLIFSFLLPLSMFMMNKLVHSTSNLCTLCLSKLFKCSNKLLLQRRIIDTTAYRSSIVGLL